MEHLIPITRTNRLLRLSRKSLNCRFYCRRLRVRLSDAAGRMSCGLNNLFIRNHDPWKIFAMGLTKSDDLGDSLDFSYARNTLLRTLP
jgi:hypothetical protein